jgi:GT2 family glycosyltransferase
MQRITFATNVGKNTLPHLKLLLESLKINLDSNDHEILIFIDSDNETVLDYLLSLQSEFTDLRIIKNNLPIPVGYAVNKTILTETAKYDIISYLQSDMVICPHYDTEVLKHVKPGRILSSTRVEPPLHGISQVTFTKDFGVTPQTFNMNDWNIFSESIKRDELIEYFFAPITYYKEDWIRLGGYDTVFRRSREDSDLVQRCLHAGIELVQTYTANVYHFTCVSSRGKDWFNKTNMEAQKRLELQNKADMVELRRFIRKWGSFNHGEKKLYKLNIDAVLKNYTIPQVIELEPFFNKIWISSETDRQTILDFYSAEHGFANELYGVNDEEWKLYKHLYRTEMFDIIVNVGLPAEYSILVEIDFTNISYPNDFFTNISNLYALLVDCEPGVYELSNIIITVRHIDTLPTPTVVNNPPRSTSLLSFY